MSEKEYKIWSLEDQEWWKKYSDMVRSGESGAEEMGPVATIPPGMYRGSAVGLPASSYRSSGSYRAMGSYLSSGSYLTSGRYVTSGSYLSSGSYLTSGSYLSSGRYFTSGSYLTSGSFSGSGSCLGSTRPWSSGSALNVFGLYGSSRSQYNTMAKQTSEKKEEPDTTGGAFGYGLDLI